MTTPRDDAAVLAAPWLGFYVELFKRLRANGRTPDVYFQEAEVLENAACDLVGLAAELRARALDLGQPTLPLTNDVERAPLDVVAFKRCFPDVPVARAADVIAIYDYLTWLSPSLVLYPPVLRQEIDRHLVMGRFSLDRSLALLRFEEQSRAEARAALDAEAPRNEDRELRSRILMLGLVEAARRCYLPR